MISPKGVDAVKSKTQELLDKSIAAMVSAIEIYNKPNFLYRGETFSILAINSWELLLKAKMLHENNNRASSLYVFQEVKKKDGQKSKRKIVKRTRSGNPFTHSLDYLAKKFIEKGMLDATVLKNIEALTEIRDSAVHFYNYSLQFNKRIQEVGTATLRNYVMVVKNWFGRDLSQYNFYLMPLSFVTLDESADVILLNSEEKNFVRFISKLEDEASGNKGKSEYSIALNLDISFSKSTSKDAMKVVLSNDPDAKKIALSDDQIREKYPLDYRLLTQMCRKRYIDFIENSDYHKLRKSLENNQKYAYNRYLDPGNSKSSRKTLYSTAILNEFDKVYKKK